MRKATSNLVLLDLNVLLALAWPNHQFHGPARRRLERSRHPWATCALTQLGFIRLSSNPHVVGAKVTPGDAASLLANLVDDARHSYLAAMPAPTEAPLREVFDRILGNKQVTDAYLIALADHHRCRLLTFDARLRALGKVELIGADST
jgi:hypothetical protein